MKSIERRALFGLKQGGTTERVEPSSLGVGMEAFVFWGHVPSAVGCELKTDSDLNEFLKGVVS